VLVKRWLLVIPQLLIVSLFIGGGLWVGNQATSVLSAPVPRCPLHVRRRG